MDLDTINKDTYSEISLEFSTTRAYVWKCVKDFCNLIDDSEEKNIIEIGCGNGKNIQYINSKKKVNIIGVDNCQNFVNLCCDRKLNVINNPITKLDFKDEAFDYMLCIAVFHHVLTDQDRQIAIKEILRVMKKNSIGIPKPLKYISSQRVKLQRHNKHISKILQNIFWTSYVLVHEVNHFYDLFY